MFLIWAADILRTQWKFGVLSTSACKSRSGGIGSNFACGCCAGGIVATATPQSVDDLMTRSGGCHNDNEYGFASATSYIALVSRVLKQALMVTLMRN
jgi:hypothetical protein